MATVTTLCCTDGISFTFSSGSRRAYNLDCYYWKSTQLRLTSVAYDHRLTDPKFGINGKLRATVNPYSYAEAAQPEERKSLADFLVEAGDFIRSDGRDCGPPRWFSPLECGARAQGSPLLLHIPGIDGTGLGLIRQHRRLGEINRNDDEGKLGKQDLHVPGIIPKIPGQLYIYFGKPIDTKGREKELNDKEKAHEVYLHVKSEVERCMAYLKTKRETDPYRNILPRFLYYLSHGFSSQVPTFDLRDP